MFDLSKLTFLNESIVSYGAFVFWTTAITMFCSAADDDFFCRQTNLCGYEDSSSQGYKWMKACGQYQTFIRRVSHLLQRINYLYCFPYLHTISACSTMLLIMLHFWFFESLYFLQCIQAGRSVSLSVLKCD